MPKLYSLLLCILALNTAQAQEFQWASYTTSTGTIQANYTGFMSDGSTIHAGYLSGTADLDAGPTEHIVTASGNTDAYILKRDAAGSVVWIHIIGGGIGFESTSDGSCKGIC